MNKKKKRFLSIVALLIILCSPLYDWIPPWPKTITLYGNMPPESHLKAVVPYYTESFLCRDFSFGSGSFLSSGKWNRRYSTVSDVKGNYEISVPIEMQSPFCKWENRGINIYFSPPNADVEVNSETYKILNINLTGNNKEKKNDIECAYTYWTFNEKKNIYDVICRSSQYTGDEKVIYKFTDAIYDIKEKRLNLNINMRNGPEYKLMRNKTEEIHNFWREFEQHNPEAFNAIQWEVHP